MGWEVSEELLGLFDSYRHFVILGHRKPDADCASSQASLYKGLQRLGRSVQAVSAGPFIRPEILHLEPLFGRSIDREPIDRFGTEQTLAVLIDCSHPERTGFAADIRDLKTLAIDHHVSGEESADYRYIDTDSPSTSVLIYNLLSSLAREREPLIDLEIAEMLVLGFATDTGYFRFLKPRNASAVLEQVAELVGFGVDLQEVHSLMHGGKSVRSRRLLGLHLLRLQDFFGGRLCLSYDLKEDFRYAELSDRDYDNFYSMVMTINACEGIVMLSEREEGWSLGFRSRKHLDVGSLAARFGGGGHYNAAGCSIGHMPMAQALETVLTLFAEVWQEHFETESLLSRVPGLSAASFFKALD